MEQAVWVPAVKLIVWDSAWGEALPVAMSCGTSPLRRRRSCLAAVRAKLVDACAEQQCTRLPQCRPCLIIACVTAPLRKEHASHRPAPNGKLVVLSGARTALRQHDQPAVHSAHYLLHIKVYLAAVDLLLQNQSLAMLAVWQLAAAN